MKKITKKILFFIIVIGSIIFLSKKNYSLGLIFLLISLFPLFFIFRNEFLLLAFLKIKKKDMKGLKKYLEYIKNPKKQLTQSQMAYYYFLYGILYSESDIQKSEKYMKKALDIGLHFQQNKAIAKLNLAIACLSRGDKKKAELLLIEAKKTDKYGLLHEQIKIIKIKMKQMHVGNINKQNPLIR
ncbi:hypothetical protein [Blattabacterium cuenoti]|uniref:hypothetical protein n=1 Tax=Blattabacterium cuenoti TaxID=1653831 RepID=UPI00163CA497|nr:hypothetical protein [Blattabacterium cuenoti]